MKFIVMAEEVETWVRTYSVEADTPEEAKAKYHSGDWDDCLDGDCGDDGKYKVIDIEEDAE